MRTFEGAAVRIKQQLATSNTATNEAHVLREDRSRLAAELDRSKAKLSDITRLHLQILRRFYPGVLERMAPLAEAELATPPEEADEKIAAAVEVLTAKRDEPIPAMPLNLAPSNRSIEVVVSSGRRRAE